MPKYIPPVAPSNGTIVVGRAGGFVVFDADLNSLTTRTGLSGETETIRITPDNKVFFSTNFGQLHAYQLDGLPVTGSTQIWGPVTTSQFDRSTQASIGPDGSIYFGTQGNSVDVCQRIDPLTGNLLDFYDVGTNAIFGSTKAIEDGSVYLLYETNTSFCNVEKRSQDLSTQLWVKSNVLKHDTSQASTQRREHGIDADIDGNVIVCAVDQVIKYDADGNEVFNITLAGITACGQLHILPDGDFIIPHPNQSIVRRYSGDDGSQVWESPTITTSFNCTSDAENFAYVINNGTIFKLSLADGSIDSSASIGNSETYDIAMHPGNRALTIS